MPSVPEGGYSTRAARVCATRLCDSGSGNCRARLTWAASNIHSFSFPDLNLLVIDLLTSIACLSAQLLLWKPKGNPLWLVADSNVTKDPPDHFSSFVCANPPLLLARSILSTTMDAIPLTNAALSSPASDLLRLSIVPPDVARYMLQDPTLKEQLDRLDADSAAAAGRQHASDWKEQLVKEGKELLEREKESHFRERSLPVARAQEPSRRELVASIASSRAHEANPDGLPVLPQALIGTRPKYSHQKLEELSRSACFFLLFYVLRLTLYLSSVNISEMLLRKRHEVSSTTILFLQFVLPQAVFYRESICFVVSSRKQVRALT